MKDGESNLRSSVNLPDNKYRIRLTRVMTIAIILAGGTGQRVGVDIPKQFLEVDGKPIIVYTLSAFQNHTEIDKIVVVCVKDWEDEVLHYKEAYGLSKISKIIAGGNNSMESIRNGVFGIEDICDSDDIAIIHDAVRPLISHEVISDCIRVCKENGNGCASIPLQETIVRTEDQISGNINIDRSKIMRVQTPQAYRYDTLLDLYKRATEIGITESIYANTLLLELGGSVFFSKGSYINMKITTSDDIGLFRTLLKYISDSSQ